MAALCKAAAQGREPPCHFDLALRTHLLRCQANAMLFQVGLEPSLIKHNLTVPIYLTLEGEVFPVMEHLAVFCATPGHRLPALPAPMCGCPLAVSSRHSCK